MNRKILFSAGELSGDEHLACLLEELQKLQPDAIYRGMAGPRTRQKGFITELNLEKFASVMGFADVIKKIPTVLKALKIFEKLIIEWKPDLLILVDYPDFNLRLAKIAKKYGVKTFYFIPPKIWAWRESRINKIKKYIDCIGLIFPFEKSFYQQLGFQHSHYLGHPFVQVLDKEYSEAAEMQKKKEFFSSVSLNPEFPTLAVFPGSRPSEIRNHAESVLETISLLSNRIQSLQVLVSAADTVNSMLVDQYADLNQSNIRILTGHNLDILRFSNIGLIKSGTSNLQAAFYLLPFIMFYKGSKLSEKIVKAFVKIKQYSLVNIIRAHSVDEFVMEAFEAKAMAERLEVLLNDQSERQMAIAKLKTVRDQLGDFEELPLFKNSVGAYQRAAILAQQLIVGEGI